MLFEVILELGKLGAYVNVAGDPLSLSISTTIAFENQVHEREVIRAVEFIKRADSVAQLVVARHTAANFYTRTATAEEVADSASPRSTTDLLEQLEQFRAQAQARSVTPQPPQETTP